MSDMTTRELDELMRDLRAERTPFALATVTRTFDATAAKAGAKAVVSADGEILAGWIGGGCARGAIGRAARTAIDRNEPVLVALRPDDRLAAEGIAACEVRDGMIYERNGCASKGSLDIFVEPFVSAPDLVILGDGPVAKALAGLARPFDFRLRDGLPPEPAGRPMHIVVATQGKGDLKALEEALGHATAEYIGFVASRRKAETLKTKLAEKGLAREAIDRLNSPAGLDIGAKTPEEIALSILAEIIQNRRSAARN